jgi:hypothetical protein
VRYEAALQRVKEERNIIHTTKKKEGELGGSHLV